MKRNTRVLGLLAFAAMAACSAGTQSGPAPIALMTGPASSSGNGPVRATATAHFTVTIPAATASASARRASYISSATQSIVITLTAVNGSAYSGSPASIASNLTTNNPDCTGTPLTCIVAAPGAPGTDTFTVATYDAPQPSTSPSTPTGNLLSQATITATILANATNAVSLVLNGIPASVTVTGLPSGTAGTAFTAQAFIVTVEDAAGRTIVGIYANPVMLSDSDTSGATSTATSGSDSPSAGQLLSSSDAATLSYTGLAIAPVTIGAMATNATSSPASFTPTPAPSASPAPGILSIAPSNSLSFAGTGASYAQTVTVTDSIATTGLIVAAQNCGTGASAIVVFGSPSGIGTTFQIVVTPLAAGSCSALISDSNGSSAPVAATVNSGSIGITGRR